MEEKKFSESQRVALLLTEEKIMTVRADFMQQLAELTKQRKDLLIILGKELGIPKDDAHNWHLNEAKTGFARQTEEKKK